ncbi:GPW/gp25 family protein [Aeromonas sp. FDAARGOS 1408]|uniref:GPW/gp25 family protein n=1 Tax=Aeromonas TaxID=642 RepID=UPI001C22E530|nr:GPW/gp25 family protein [Aeromonas sp. FDAARGOS 1408]QXC09800.1 GPW/gp25 family protein [Aeromonas sp. FDAARGOS 1408]
MNWLGMNAANGCAISATDHIIQSVRDILLTPVGSRVMRRDYGSELFYLIDMPQHQATRLRLMAATVQALINWEPRITVTRVDVLGSGMDGALTIELTWQRKDGGVLESATIPIPTGATQ